MNTETKVTTGATDTTYDIELPPLPEDKIIGADNFIIGTLEVMELDDVQDYARTAIEADRKKFGRNDNDHCKRRGEPVNHSFQDCPEVDKWNCKYCKRVNSCPVQGHQDAQPAESVSRDVEALVRLLEDGEWAEHVARTPLGQRLELAITTLVGEASKPHNEPVKCIGCEGKPAPENNPCAVCGKEAEPVKPHLTVKYDDKGDCLYICCDRNEPAEAEENDQGILLWRAYSDGRLVGVTIPNFIGPYIKPVKEDAEASVLSDADVKHVQDFINCDGMGQ